MLQEEGWKGEAEKGRQVENVETTPQKKQSPLEEMLS